MEWAALPLRVHLLFRLMTNNSCQDKYMNTAQREIWGRENGGDGGEGYEGGEWVK